LRTHREWEEKKKGEKKSQTRTLTRQRGEASRPPFMHLSPYGGEKRNHLPRHGGPKKTFVPNSEQEEKGGRDWRFQKPRETVPPLMVQGKKGGED